MNQEIKIAVCDDLAEDRENITRLLSEYTDKNNLYVKIEEFSSGEAFLSSDTSVYSLVFMDIFLADQNGIDIVRKIRQTDSKVLIVFLTTSADHIFEAAPFHFFDYILKPFEYKQISHVLDEAQQILPKSEVELTFEYRNFDVHFPLSKIQYIYSNNHEVIIHTSNGSQTFRLPFYSITENLNDPRFLQCNRGIMLNMDYIKTMESDYFEMTNSKCFPIKTKGRKQIREQYIPYML